jgi:integrase
MYAEKVVKKRKINGRWKEVVTWRARDRASGTIIPCEDEAEAKITAKDWNQQQGRVEAGLPAGTPKDLRKYTVRKIVREYIANRRLTQDENDKDENELREELKKELGVLLEKEELKGKICPKNAFPPLWAFSCRREADLTLYAFNKHVAQKYVDDRLEEPRKNSKSGEIIAATSVYWEVARIRLVWKWAKKFYRDLSHLQNPWEVLEWPEGAASNPRDRELVGDELERLITACEGCLGLNKYYLPLGIYLATETGMRRQEFVDYLHWEDVDFERRRIVIRKSKTDRKTRTKNLQIVLPAQSQVLLMELAGSLAIDGRLPGYPERMPSNKEPGKMPTGRVFPMSGEAFSDAFDAAVVRAKIEDLHLHDLRQTATTLFIRAGLEPEERQVMKRETFKKTVDAKHYQGDVSREIHLERIQDKLDKYTLGGRTLEEVTTEGSKKKREFVEEFGSLFEEALQAGMTRDEARKEAGDEMLRKYPRYTRSFANASSRLRARLGLDLETYISMEQSTARRHLERSAEHGNDGENE